jgi:hypothetical protein
MRRALASFGLLVMLAACGAVPSAESLHPLPAPASASDQPHSSIAMLEGVWDVKEPPIKLTFDLDVHRVIIEHKGLPIKQFWRLMPEREDGESVFLRGPKTSGGGAIKLRFISDDIVQWQSMTQDTLWTLTRKP